MRDDRRLRHRDGTYQPAQVVDVIRKTVAAGCRPLGIAMVGGLLLSQALTLYTTPVIYIFFDTLGQRFSRWRGSEKPRTVGEPEAQA